MCMYSINIKKVILFISMVYSQYDFYKKANAHYTIENVLNITTHLYDMREIICMLYQPFVKRLFCIYSFGTIVNSGSNIIFFWFLHILYSIICLYFLFLSILFINIVLIYYIILLNCSL